MAGVTGKLKDVTVFETAHDDGKVRGNSWKRLGFLK